MSPGKFDSVRKLAEDARLRIQGSQIASQIGTVYIHPRSGDGMRPSDEAYRQARSATSSRVCASLHSSADGPRSKIGCTIYGSQGWIGGGHRDDCSFREMGGSCKPCRDTVSTEVLIPERMTIAFPLPVVKRCPLENAEEGLVSQSPDTGVARRDTDLFDGHSTQGIRGEYGDAVPLLKYDYRRVTIGNKEPNQLSYLMIS